MKVLVALVILAALSSVGLAQSFIASGIQYKYGEFGLYDVPNSKLGSANAVGAFIEGAHDFKVGSATIAPRVLASLERNYPDQGHAFTQFDVRPETELRFKLAHDLEPLVAVGFNYTEAGKAHTQINPILGAGLQYEYIRASVYRFFPDADNSNARGTLYRLDVWKAAKPVGIRVSAELFKGRSELQWAPQHPGYSGTTFTLRVAALFGGHEKEPLPVPDPTPLPAVRK